MPQLACALVPAGLLVGSSPAPRLVLGQRQPFAFTQQPLVHSRQRRADVAELVATAESVGEGLAVDVIPATECGQQFCASGWGAAALPPAVPRDRA